MPPLPSSSVVVRRAIHARLCAVQLYNMNAADVYKYYKLPKLADVNKRFQADLDAVTLAIDANQSVRLGRTPKVDYRFLYPENLLNSICI